MLREQIQQQPSVQSGAGSPAKPELGQKMRPSSASPLSEGQLHELLRLRGEVGVLGGQLAEVVAQMASQKGQYQEVVKQMDSIKGEFASEMRRSEGRRIDNLAETTKLLVTAQSGLGVLASALNVPEPVAKMNSEEGLRNENLKQDRAYFLFKGVCEGMQMAVENQRKAQVSAE